MEKSVLLSILYLLIFVALSFGQKKSITLSKIITFQKMKSNFEVKKQYVVKQADFKSNLFTKRLVEELVNANIYILEWAKKTGLKVIIYNFESENSVSKQFKLLEKFADVNDEGTLGKDYDLFLPYKQSIIRIDAICSFNKTEWNQIKNSLLKEYGDTSYIEVHCGGAAFKN